MPRSTADVLKLLERNRRRGHEVSALAIDLKTSEAEIELALKQLVAEGKVTEGEWATGHTVYHAATPQRAEQEVA